MEAFRLMKYDPGRGVIEWDEEQMRGQLSNATNECRTIDIHSSAWLEYIE